jgi:hypothetical protein
VEELRSAQARAFKTGGDDASRFAAARADLKERTRDVVQAVREVMSMEGLAWTREAQRRVARTLHAVPFASPEDRARLFAGRLDRDLEAAADFGSLAGGAPTERERDEEKTNNRIERPKGEKKKGEMQERAARARAQGEATARARREAAERARVEAKERALVRARDARMKKILASAQAAQSEADRLEAQAANAEKRAAKARLAADAARAAAVKAREAAAEASTKAAEALLALSQGSRAYGAYG